MTAKHSLEMARLEADFLRFQQEVVRSIRQLEQAVLELQQALAEREPLSGGADSRSASAVQPVPLGNAEMSKRTTAQREGGALSRVGGRHTHDSPPSADAFSLRADLL